MKMFIDSAVRYDYMPCNPSTNMALQAGIDVKALQYNPGHYSSAFTLDVYGHFTIDMQKTSAKKCPVSFRKYFRNEIGH
ncbi:MAG: hypothetical protein MJ095_08455 [Oscillospiraceae bacterium]|nr:hypothetical protein [Oscillospiraceae bacterium]